MMDKAKLFSPTSYLQNTLQNTFTTNGDGNSYTVTQTVNVNSAGSVILTTLFKILVFLIQMAIGIILAVILGTIWLIIAFVSILWDAFSKGDTNG